MKKSAFIQLSVILPALGLLFLVGCGDDDTRSSSADAGDSDGTVIFGDQDTAFTNDAMADSQSGSDAGGLDTNGEDATGDSGTQDAGGEDAVGDDVSDVGSEDVTVALPTASAGPDQDVPTTALVTLDGSASTLGDDATEVVLSYTWSLLNQPMGSTAALTGDDSSSPTLTPDVSGAYEIQLVVNDGAGDSQPDTVQITAAPGVLLFGRPGEEHSLQTLADYLQDEGLFALWVENDNWWISHMSLDGDAFAYIGNELGPLTLWLSDLETLERLELDALEDAAPESVQVVGDWVVWAESKADSADGTGLYAYQISTGETTTLAVDTRQRGWGFHTDGSTVVWQGVVDEQVDIFAYDFGTESRTQLTDDDAAQFSPEVSGDYVVYGQVDGVDGSTVLLNTDTDETTTLFATNGVTQLVDGLLAFGSTSCRTCAVQGVLLTAPSEPVFLETTNTRGQTNGEVILWVGKDADGNNSLNGYDFTVDPDMTEPRFEIPTVEDSLALLDLAGELVVYLDNGIVHVYNLTTQEDTTLPSALSEDGNDWITDGDSLAFRFAEERPAAIVVTRDLGSTLLYPQPSFGDHLDSLLEGVTAVLFVGLSPSLYLEMFEHVDAANVPILSLSGSEYGLTTELSEMGSYAINAAPTDGCLDLRLDVPEAQRSHPIFRELDPSMLIPAITFSETVKIRGTLIGTNEEDDASPDDWTTLASFHPDAFEGDCIIEVGTPLGAIVSFTTDLGTTILLDGAGLEHGEFAQWTDQRWALFLNEVLYLTP